MAGGGYDIGASLSMASSSGASQSGATSQEGSGGNFGGTNYGPGTLILGSATPASGLSFSMNPLILLGIAAIAAFAIFQFFKR